MTPERWLLQIHQAREVRKIERMQQLEDLGYKAMIARARAVLNAELAGDTVSRSPELAGLLLTSEKLTRQALLQVADGYNAMYDAELRLGLEGDRELEERYRTAVNHLLHASNELPSLPGAPATPSLPPQPQPQGPAPTGSGGLDRLSPLARQNYIAARNVLGEGAWMRRDLEGALSCQHSEASERIREWKLAGLVVDVSDPKWHYRFV